MLIAVDRVKVLTGRLVMDVRVCEGTRFVTPDLARRALAAYPALDHHACVNGVGPTFGCVLGSTSLPHLLEHLVIDIQTRLSDDAHATFAGTSEWLDQGAGRARVQVSFADDLHAFAALGEALAFLNGRCASF